MNNRFLIRFAIPHALLILGMALWSTAAWSQTKTAEAASQLELQGQFTAASNLLASAINAKSLPAQEIEELRFELDRLARIKRDFPYTEKALYDELKTSVRGLTPEEYAQWVKAGRFDSRVIDGTRYFMSASESNLYFRYPDLNYRRIGRKDPAPQEKAHLEACVAIKQAVLEEKQTYVLPKRFHAAMTITAKTNAAPPGEIVHAWLPIPRRYPFQGDFELLSSSPSTIHLDGNQSRARAIFLEQPARNNKPLDFKVEYEYTIHGVWFDLKPELIQTANASDPELAEYLKEAPHVVFTPELRALSQQIIGAETNACLQARKCYEWIASHIQYSYAIEYSTIRNISDYCRAKGYGDCGQEALLFITLCRLNGIPARWQSGWNTFPGEKTIHDWSEIYLAPSGWVPVDPYMGIYATRYADSLTPGQKSELRDFYFGGLDQYRMIANSDHNQILTPRKSAFRSDNVDFQRGELEWGTHNIYFDKFSYKLDVKEVKLPKRDTNLKPAAAP